MYKKNMKEIIIRTATDCFSQKGYKETSIKEIGKAAKINSALCYYYFKNKEEILYVIIEGAIRALINILEGTQSETIDPLECLKEMIARQVIYSSKNHEATKISTRYTDQLSAQRKKHCLSLQKDIYNIYMNQLGKLKKVGMLRDVHLIVLIFSILGIINWFPRWFHEKGRLSVNDVAYEITEILFHGILKTKQDIK